MTERIEPGTGNNSDEPREEVVRLQRAPAPDTEHAPKRNQPPLTITTGTRDRLLGLIAAEKAKDAVEAGDEGVSEVDNASLPDEVSTRLEAALENHWAATTPPVSDEDRYRRMYEAGLPEARARAERALAALNGEPTPDTGPIIAISGDGTADLLP